MNAKDVTQHDHAIGGVGITLARELQPRLAEYDDNDNLTASAILAILHAIKF